MSMSAAPAHPSTAAQTARVRVEGLARSFDLPEGRTLSILRDVNLSLAAGESLAITGPSGSGKSTLLSILGTLDRPTSGMVEIDGVDPFTLDANHLAAFRNRRIGFIFQDHHLLAPLSARENVLLPTLPYSPDAEQRAADRAVDFAKRAEELLTSVGLAERIHQPPAQLSGGERQRVAVARALIRRPALLLADEPTGSLDRTTADAVGDLLLALPKEHSAALIVVTHSERLAARFPRRCRLDDGRLLMESA